MERNKHLLDIRPQLILKEEKTGSLELFQNKVLRPILKFQNDLIVESLFSHPQFIQQLAKINKDEPKTYEATIIRFFKNNNGFRNTLYGMIFGLMTKEEYRVYADQASEYNRRIVTMCIQRVMNQPS